MLNLREQQNGLRIYELEFSKQGIPLALFIHLLFGIGFHTASGSHWALSVFFIDKMCCACVCVLLALCHLSHLGS